MAEITYLLGAGASYNALPVVSDMFDKLGDAINWFRKECKVFVFSQNGKIVKSEIDEKIEKIISDLEWLKKICDQKVNVSVDTFARTLKTSQNIDEYQKLKNILSFYFTIEQRRNLPDARYGNFWASILKSRLEFPNNIKIISWNYDF